MYDTKKATKSRDYCAFFVTGQIDEMFNTNKRDATLTVTPHMRTLRDLCVVQCTREFTCYFLNPSALLLCMRIGKK